MRMARAQRLEPTRTFLLQAWNTVRASTGGVVVQDAADWVDLAGFADAGLWIDVSSVSVTGVTLRPPVNIILLS